MVLLCSGALFQGPRRLLNAVRAALKPVRTMLVALRRRLAIEERPLNVLRTMLTAMRCLLTVEKRPLNAMRKILDAIRTMLHLVKTGVDRARTVRNAPDMTQNQENRVTMFGTVSDYMNSNTNKAIWTPMKAAVETVAEFDAGIEAIAEKTGKQKAPTTGAADAKGNVRHDYEAKILEIGDQLASVAAATNDPALAAQVQFSKAGLGRLSDDDLETAGKRVTALAKANMAALADHLVTAADVAELEQLTADFDAIKNQPRTAIAGRAGETATLPDQIAAATNLLRDRLDKQMTKFRQTNPEFYAGYQSVRVVVDRGGSAPAKPPVPPPAPAK